MRPTQRTGTTLGMFAAVAALAVAAGPALASPAGALAAADMTPSSTATQTT